MLWCDGEWQPAAAQGILFAARQYAAPARYMSDKQRQIGGDNNKRGSRYEDFFAVSRLIQFASRTIEHRSEVRMKEQADCPVDDFLLIEPESHHFHQLKASKDITWGKAGRKLEKEFLDQKDACREAGHRFQLVVVVADEKRKESLTANMPPALAECTTVLLFPELKRPSQLVRHDETEKAIAAIYAGRGKSVSEYENIVNAFLIAWKEHEPDASGLCHLDSVVTKIHQLPIGLLRCVWDERPEVWREAERILNSIRGLQWWVDRGYFEWALPPADHGICREPCGSDSFQRFIERLVDHRPASFADFERLLS